MKATKRLITLLLAVIMLLTLIPAAAFADEDPFPQNVTIESEKNNAFDYLEYYSGGKWKDLNTPRHWIESTGQVCYCIEHSEGNPHGASYTATPPSQVFSANTLAGLQTILMYGYPCNTPDGFTEDEARQATANAIRFWLSENGEPGSYSFTNRKAHPTYIRAKKGYEHVLTWADELLQMARDKKTLSHNIEFTPSALTLTKSGDTFTGKTTVKLTNINSGYTLDTSKLPAGVTVTGYSGTKGEVLTITAPSSAAGKTFNISAAGKDTRALQNMTAYVPSNDSLQKIFLCANTAQVVATASIGVNTPATGALQIKKYGDSNKPLAGVKFAVYSDAACTKKVTEVTTGNDGAVLIENLDGGTYYVKEIGTVKPYVIDGLINTVIVKASETATLEVYNETAKGQIRITKRAETLVSTTATTTEFGQLHRPNYKEAGLPGCTFVVKDSTGKVIATLTTDSNGYCETGLLPFGQYTVQETAVPAGYTIDDSVRTVNLEYKDQYTPIVYGDVAVTNSRIPTSVKIKKMTDFFDTKTMKFVEKPLEGAIFGLYTAENIGIIPKNTMVDLLTTGADGTATSTSVLPFGKYYLRELKLPDNTIHLSSESYPLEVKGNNTDYVKEPIWNERFKGNIAMWKEDDSNPGRMLEGAQYEVRDKDGLLYCTMVTDKDGYALSIDLPVGTYYVREVVPPAGFILSDEVIEVKITTDDKNTIVFERDNTPNHVVLKKTDLTTGKPVPDAMIVITNEKGDVIFEGETDLNGEIILYELPAGKYTYKETVAADGYAINDETFTFTVDYYGKVTGTTEITDEPICLQIDKVDLFTGKPFPYVEFQLVDQDDQVIRTIVATMGAEAQVKAAPVSKSIVISNADDYRIWAKDGQDTFFVDENGHVEFRYLPAGEYRLIEIAPDGYIAEDSISITLTDHDSVSNPKVVRVENCPTGIKILKVDASSGNPLMGAGFRIKVKGETDFETLTFRALDDGSYFCDPEGKITDLMVDGNGELTLYGVPLGDIWVEECVTPEGYFPISAQKLTVTKEMSNDKPYTLRIENHKFVKLGMDSDWWEFPAMCLGVLLVLGGLVTAMVIVQKKRRLGRGRNA
ncbi:MAG: hypothetical protein IKP38_00755 [Clostridia bacterium]|nr:hypothetical protein [Clostridia bacterium]